MLPADAFAAAVGEEPTAPGEPFPAAGAVLGGCEYEADSGASATVYARVLSEFETTVAAYGAAPVADLPDAFYSQDVGLLVPVSVSGYYLQVMAGTRAFRWEEAPSVAIAREILDRV